VELRHLRYFVAVAEELNFSRAAQRLHVSQPPLSRQIRDLEAELNVRLFERTRQSVRLTSPGRITLLHARKLLRDSDLLRSEAQIAAGTEQEELHIGYAPSPTAELLSPVLCRFQELAPRARVTFHDLNQAGILLGLIRRTLDAAITIRPRPAEMRGLKFEPVGRYRLGIICSELSPWSKHKSISPKSLVGTSLVGYQIEDFPEYYQIVSKVLGVSPGRLKVRQQCDGAVSLVAAVESGRVPAVVGEFILGIAGNRITFVPFSGGTSRVQVGILYRGSGLSERAKVFVEACRGVGDHSPVAKQQARSRAKRYHMKVP
jgi:LysR family transcriptional regulator, benzoate and cis,cis-muconate-responsive activator of ben and cat genes